MSNIGFELNQELVTMKSDISSLKEDFNRLLQTSITKVESERIYMDDAAAYLGLAKGTLYNHTHRRNIGYSRLGGKICFTKKQLDDFIAERTVLSRREIAIEMHTKIACGNGYMAKPTSYKSKRSN